MIWGVRILLAALAALSGPPTAAAAPPAPRPATPRVRATSPRRAASAPARQPRRPLEGLGGGARGRVDRPLHIPVAEPKGCPLGARPALVTALEGLVQRSQLMSLELWGDAERYRPHATVIYHLRAERAGYVTLFWIGPRGDVFVPFDGLPVPGGRDVSVDAASVVVPPLGHERWVAVITLEPVPLPCAGSDEALLRMLERIRATPHAVGRWEVRSFE